MGEWEGSPSTQPYLLKFSEISFALFVGTSKIIFTGSLCVCNQFLTMHQQAVVQAVLLNRSSEVVLESVPQNFCLLREYTFKIFIFTHPDTTDTIGFNAFSIEITSGRIIVICVRLLHRLWLSTTLFLVEKNFLAANF